MTYITRAQSQEAHTMTNPQTATRQFHLGDILSITTECLVSCSGKHPIDGVYDILNFMTGESLYTHQLPRVGKEAKPVLIMQHPQLAGVDASGVDGTNWRAWLDVQIAKFGESLPVAPMNADQHEYREPLSELAEKIPPERIIVLRTDGKPQS